jgi:LacI family transcriptional regulator
MEHITIKDVAKKLGVSISTISRAFNNKYDIKKETREIVLRTAEEMGYNPNPIARKLIQKHSLNIGVVVPEFTNDYFSEIIIALQEFLQPKGYQILIMQSNEDEELEFKNVETLIHNMVDGLIIAPVAGNKNINSYLEYHKKGFPIVFINRVTEKLPATKVIFNDFKWSFFATEHLIRQNYKKIYHLSGNKNLCITKERTKGFIKAMKKHKIPEENYKIIETGLLPKQGMDVIEDLIFNHDIPNALFCVNDMVALGAIKKLKDNGYRVPEDVAIVGFTETRMAELITPQLTSVKQPTFEMAKKAGELLLERILNNDTKIETVIMNGELTIRKSSMKS